MYLYFSFLYFRPFYYHTHCFYIHFTPLFMDTGVFFTNTWMKYLVFFSYVEIAYETTLWSIQTILRPRVTIHCVYLCLSPLVDQVNYNSVFHWFQLRQASPIKTHFIGSSWGRPHQLKHISLVPAEAGHTN
jgi:hypothetical protein